MKSVWVVIITVIVTAGVIGGGIYYWINQKSTGDKDSLQAQIDDLNKKYNLAQKSLGDLQSTPTIISEVSNKVVDWKTYSNTKYGYSFKYSSNVKLTASDEMSDDLNVSPIAGGVNVYLADGKAGDEIFRVTIPNIDFNITAIRAQFSATKAEDISIKPTTINGGNGYVVTILNDNSVVSTFYFIKNTAGTVLVLTVRNNNIEAQNILSSFKITN